MNQGNVVSVNIGVRMHNPEGNHSKRFLQIDILTIIPNPDRRYRG